MPDLIDVLARAISRPDVLALGALAALLLTGRALFAAFPDRTWFRTFRAAPPMPHAARLTLRRALWRRMGIRLLAATLLLPPLAFALSVFNPLTGGRLAMAIAVPIAMLAGAAACFRKAASLRD